jgi:uncharacterized protein YkwD
LLLIAAALAMGGGASARADWRDAVNWARVRGCAAAAATRPALRESPKLEEAARRLKSGYSLHRALAAAGYRASQSSALHLSGALSDADVSRALRTNYCALLLDSKLREVGAERGGHDLWIILAAPFELPSLKDADSISREILNLVNAARASGYRCGGKYYAPVRPLVFNSALSEAALEHSRDMAKYGSFDHRGHDGTTPSTRVRRAGYGGYRVVGENIAAGPMTPPEVTQGWLRSPAHCENIMDARFSEIGIAFAENAATSAGIYWTEDFAAPRP